MLYRRSECPNAQYNGTNCDRATVTVGRMTTDRGGGCRAAVLLTPHRSRPPTPLTIPSPEGLINTKRFVLSRAGSTGGRGRDGRRVTTGVAVACHPGAMAV